MAVDVILAAGSRLDSELIADAGTEARALVRLSGRTLLEGTIAALRGSGFVNRIAVLGPESVTGDGVAALVDAAVADDDFGPESLMRGIQSLRGADRVLLLTPDLPFVTEATLALFLEACPTQAEVCIPVISRGDFEARFPGAGGRFLRLKDGDWTMGCAVLADPAVIERNLQTVETLLDARANQARLAGILGPLFILKFLSGQVGLMDIKDRCLDLLGCTGNLIIDSPPELAFDLGSEEQYRFAIEAASADRT